MNIEVGFIDQHVRGLAERLGERLDDALGRRLDETARRSAAFVTLCAKTMLALTEDEALATPDHRNFVRAQGLVEQRGDAYSARAVQALETALGQLYGDTTVSLQRLSATFRRGDQLEFLRA